MGSFSAVAVIPGSDMYDMAVKDKYFIPRDIDGLSGQSEMDNYCDSKDLPKEEILRLTNVAYKRFYLRPGHILRLFGLMIRDHTLTNFIRISPYVLKRIFGQYQQVKR